MLLTLATNCIPQVPHSGQVSYCVTWLSIVPNTLPRFKRLSFGLCRDILIVSSTRICLQLVGLSTKKCLACDYWHSSQATGQLLLSL